MKSLRSICVYCGSSPGSSVIIHQAARQLGRLMAEQGITLIYGGGNVGLMGMVADAVLSSGGKAVGIITEGLMEREVGHTGLSELRIVKTMHERKAMMADLADGFIAMPGGVGTLDELFEVLTWSNLRIHSKRVGLLNTEGFYDILMGFLQSIRDKGFMRELQIQDLIVASEPGDLLDRLRS